MFSLCGARAAGIAKGFEYAEIELIFGDAPLGMPLHAEQKTGSFVTERFDQAVRRHRFHLEALAQARDALPVQLVDPGRRRAGYTGQQPARIEGDDMRGGILLFERIIGIFAMV